jgi:hypothetical protein
MKWKLEDVRLCMDAMLEYKENHDLSHLEQFNYEKIMKDLKKKVKYHANKIKKSNTTCL